MKPGTVRFLMAVEHAQGLAFSAAVVLQMY